MEVNAIIAFIWWHKALFFLELGNLEEALLIYDEEILPVMRPVATQLCNPTALLWRLEILGLKAGGRWQDLLPLWQEQPVCLSPRNSCSNGRFEGK